MSEKINLKTKKKESKKLVSYLSGSSILFGVAMCLAVGIILVNLVLRAQLNGLTNQESQVVSQYNAQGEKRAKYLVAQDQLQHIRTILDTRQALSERLNGLFSILPANLFFNKISADSLKISLGISSTDLSALNKIVEDELPNYAKNPTSDIKTINLTNFGTSSSPDETGQYDVSFDIQYK